MDRVQWGSVAEWLAAAFTGGAFFFGFVLLSRSERQAATAKIEALATDIENIGVLTHRRQREEDDPKKPVFTSVVGNGSSKTITVRRAFVGYSVFADSVTTEPLVQTWLARVTSLEGESAAPGLRASGSSYYDPYVDSDFDTARYLSEVTGPNGTWRVEVVVGGQRWLVRRTNDEGVRASPVPD